MSSTNEAKTKQVLEDVCRILEEEKDSEKKKQLVESIVKAISDGYGAGPNFEEICHAAAKMARRSAEKAENSKEEEEVENALAIVPPSLQATPDEDMDDLMNMPWMWCITLSQLKEIARCAKNLHGKRWYEKANMHQIVEEIIVPICTRSGKGYWASQNPNGLKVTVFVTHNWQENFKEMVDSISSVFENSLQEPHLWICAFALIQGDYDTMKHQVDGVNSSLRGSPFVLALKKADTFLVVRNSLGDLYARVWCVCELMFAMEFDMVPSRTYITGPDNFADNTSGCLEAEASVEADKTRILSHLTTKMSTDEVDEKIQEFRKMKLPSQTNFARRLKLFIVFLLIILVAAAVSLSIVLTRPSAEERIQDIIEDEMPGFKSHIEGSDNVNKYKTEAYNIVVKSYKTGNMKIEEEEVLRKYSLATMYYATGGNTWTHDENWMSNKDECDWFGINCTNDGMISEISLPNNDLTNNIPSEIALLQSLTKLDISNNDIRFVPGEIASLPSLSSLWLHHNNFTTSNVTDGVKDLVISTYRKKILKKFGTPINDSGTPQYQALQNITDSIGNNEISVNEDLWRRYVLTTLYFTTDGDGWEWNLKWLSSSDVCDWYRVYCNKEDEVDSLTPYNNNLVGRVPKELGALTKMTVLDLEENQLTGTISTELGALTKMSALYLDGNQLTGSIPTELGQLTKLRFLNLHNNELSGYIPDGLLDNEWKFKPSIDCDKVVCKSCRGYNSTSGKTYDVFYDCPQ